MLNTMVLRHARNGFSKLFKRCMFNYRDAFLLDNQLSSEEKSIRDMASVFSKNILQPNIVSSFRHERFDKNLMKEMGKCGLLGPTIHDYGCPGVNYVSYGLIMREIERVDSGYRSCASVQSSLVMHPIYKFGSQAQRTSTCLNLQKVI